MYSTNGTNIVATGGSIVTTGGGSVIYNGNVINNDGIISSTVVNNDYYIIGLIKNFIGYFGFGKSNTKSDSNVNDNLLVDTIDTESDNRLNIYKVEITFGHHIIYDIKSKNDIHKLEIIIKATNKNQAIKKSIEFIRKKCRTIYSNKSDAIFLAAIEDSDLVDVLSESIFEVKLFKETIINIKHY
ncbi:hypothetical protein mvi_928 [Megavirus vitis]|uniref:Uncharacterized protein n=1 Tax=Megavirus courdo7 TaxID=1128135 RepID=H2ECD7_9VIRU|nr:hypothetical protein c7_L1213 [Megavirus courdo7]AVL94288.1 hypothetical protein mvi_928 [Megavirus vitis]